MVKIFIAICFLFNFNVFTVTSNNTCLSKYFYNEDYIKEETDSYFIIIREGKTVVLQKQLLILDCHTLKLPIKGDYIICDIKLPS